MKKERLHILFQLYLDQKCNPSEEIELMHLLGETSNDEEREILISECYDSLPETYLMIKSDADRLFGQIIEKPVKKLIPSFLNQKSFIRWTCSAAAVALIFIAINVVMNRNHKSVDEFNKIVKIAESIKNEKPLYKNDIKAGGNQAILTLANGSKIVLRDASRGVLVRQGNTSVIKLDSGKVAYRLQNITKIPTKTVYNTLTTPRGSQFSITLPDGTMVWLNASTTLFFPITFEGNERKVEVIGEAYFEVAKNESMPFIVKAGNEEIKVLGTHFNVSAYADDKLVKTTLLEGRVEVTLANSENKEGTVNTLTLVPGQQSRLDKNNTLRIVDADLKEAVAWKNGYFYFVDENIVNIMSKISRWYDVKVVYEIDPENKNFSGSISRNKNVSEVLSMLELTKAVHFKIENKTITILP